MRIKRGVSSHKRHKKLLRSVKGYRMTKRRLVKVKLIFMPVFTLMPAEKRKNQISEDYGLPEFLLILKIIIFLTVNLSMNLKKPKLVLIEKCCLI